MSVLEYDIGRHDLSHALPYGNYYYTNRNAPLALSYATRSDPRGYPTSRPVNGTRGRSGASREDVSSESGQSRRRIAVACARCRKRKIRCSGDPGTGMGCTNCNQAGIDPTHCQFHRVGSDQVHKVIDNLNISNSLNGLASSQANLPPYSSTGNSIYPRSIPTPQFPHLGTKAMYHSPWTIPYTEETAPVDTYGLDQPPAYQPNPTPMTNTNMYDTSYRWSHPIAKSFLRNANAYYDQDSSYATHNLPYIHTNVRSPATHDELSPLNMSSLHLSLPEKPHPRQLSDATAPRRQLPIPFPSSAQTTRNVVDQMQDQRLRSAQVMSVTSTAAGSFVKPTLIWGIEGDNQLAVNVSSEATSSNVAAQIPAIAPMHSTTDSTLDFFPPTTSENDNATLGASSQLQLNFSASSLLEAMNTPASTTTYSNFRECRVPASSTQITRQSSQTNMYSFNSDSVPNRNSFSGEASTPNLCTNNSKYMPLSQQPQRTPSIDIVHLSSLDSDHVPLQRASMSNLSGSY